MALKATAIWNECHKGANIRLPLPMPCLCEALSSLTRSLFCTLTGKCCRLCAQSLTKPCRGKGSSVTRNLPLTSLLPCPSNAMGVFSSATNCVGACRRRQQGKESRVTRSPSTSNTLLIPTSRLPVGYLFANQPTEDVGVVTLCYTPNLHKFKVSSIRPATGEVSRWCKWTVTSCYGRNVKVEQVIGWLRCYSTFKFHVAVPLACYFAPGCIALQGGLQRYFALRGSH